MGHLGKLSFHFRVMANQYKSSFRTSVEEIYQDFMTEIQLFLFVYRIL